MTYPDTSGLPVNLDTTHPDDAGDATVKAHQQHHDLVHDAVQKTPELIRDTIGTALVAGANVTITPNDAADTITIAAAGGGGPTLPFGSKRGGTDYRGAPGWTVVGTAQAAGAMSPFDTYTFSIHVPRAITLTGWDIFVNGGAEAGKVFRLGVYAPATDLEDEWSVGSLVADTGTVAVTATGGQAKTGLSVPLAAGRHVLGIATNAAAMQLYCVSAAIASGPIDLGLGSNAAVGAVRWWFDYSSAVDHPATGMPTTLSGGSDHGSAFQVAGNSGLLPVTLRWTNP